MKKIRLNETDLKNIILRVISENDKDVVCQNCGWSWDIEDDDPEPYLCHKCGHENIPGETEEGVGAYDAPSFEMEPDHVHFKNQYNEQEDEDGESFTINFHPDDEEKRNNDFLNSIPDGPGKVLNTKFKGKTLKYTEGPLVVEYTIEGIGPGEDFGGGTAEEFGISQGTTEIGGWAYINKVLFKNNDVTEFNRYLEKYKRSPIKDNLSRDANIEVYKVAKNFGIEHINIRFS